MVTAETILNIARAEIGTKATGNNNVKYNTAFYNREIDDPDYAWCVVFVWWCFREAGNVNMFCYGEKTASTNHVQNTYTKKGTFLTDKNLFRPGDLAVFPGHLAIIESVDIENDKLYTIDGNWSNSVKRVTRTLSTCGIEGACRVPYDVIEEPEPEEPEEPDIPNDTPTETPDVVGDGDGLIIVKVYTEGLTGKPETYNTEGEHLLSPFSECYRLDEALDNASITLAFIDRKEPFEPFTFVSLDDTNADNDAEFWCVQNDEVTEYPSIGKYTHKILLIETTKYLERFMVGTKTVTQRLSQKTGDYTSLNVHPTETEGNHQTGDASLSVYKTPLFLQEVQKKGLKIASFDEVFYNFASEYSYWNITNMKIVISDKGEEIWTKTVTDRTAFFDADLSCLDHAANIRIKYSCNQVDNGDVGRLNTAVYTISILDEPLTKTYYISDICKILCDTADPHLQEGSSRFSFFDEWGLSVIESPEFTFTEANLYEALATIGGYIHALPRLKVFFDDNKNPILRVRFDFFGENETVDLRKYLPVNGRRFTQDMEQFATGFDTYAENLVPPTNKDNAIGAPGKKLNKTLRAEEGEYRVTEATAVFATDYPIEKIHRVRISYNSGDIVDITKYIYEQAEYAALSSYEKAYPWSKQYALYYIQGEKNIRGLSFEVANELGEIFEDPAIVAIYEKEVEGADISSWYKPAEQMRFKIEVIYTPIISAEIRQRKDSVAENTKNILLAYNQSAHKIDSSAYGQNLAGTISRLGIPQTTRLYVTDRKTARTTAKTLVGKESDNGTITSVTVEYFSEYAKVQLELTKNFNRVSQYVGIKSNIRQYEISEKLSQDRHIVYEDYLVISDTSKYPDTAGSLMTPHFFEGLSGRFCGSDTVFKHQIDCGLLRGYNSSGDPMQSVFLPAVSFGVGRSMAFTMKYLDNYGAGYGTVCEETKGYRIQENVQYTNIFGEIETLSIFFYSSALINKRNYLINSRNNFPALSKVDREKFANKDESQDERILGTSKTNRLVVHKDNRENLHLTYQIHIVSDGDIIISPNAGEHLGLVSDPPGQLYIVKLRYPIGRFEKKIPDDSAMNKLSIAANYEVTCESDYLILSPQTGMSFGDQHGVSGKAWAVTDGSGNIIFSRNASIAPKQALPTLYIAGTHSLEKL